ncbi:MAG: AI-2E family transporter [Clostridia bacterium]|nr:AI-2E family transporter [Clostridia bacterium]
MLKKLDWKTVFKIGVGVIAVYLAIHYWPNISGILGTVLSAALPIIIGAAVAYPLNILMSFYERHYFPKSQKPAVIKSRKAVSLVGAVITVLGIISLVIGLIAPQLVACIQMLVNEIPGAMDYVVSKLKENEFISKNLIDSLASVDWKSRITDIMQTVTSGIGDVAGVAVSAVSSVFSGVFNIVLGVIFALYILIDKKRLGRQFNKVSVKYIPARILGKITHIIDVLNDCFHRFIVGQCTEAVILGVLCIIGMAILRIPYALMIGTLMGFTALIPIVGGLIGAGVGAFLILMESPVKALIFIIFVIILQQVEGNLIYPKVVGSSIGLPGLWVLAAVTVGGGVFGIFGMLIGVPVVATVYRLVREDVTHEKETLFVGNVEASDADDSEV